MRKTKLTNCPTPEQASEFDEYVAFWQEVLNLADWRLERGHRPIKNAMASVEFNDAARLAIYRLGDFGAAMINDITLSQTALHEVLHVFLHELITTAQDRGASPEQLEAAEHRVVNVLEKVLFGAPEDDGDAKSDTQRPAVH